MAAILKTIKRDISATVWTNFAKLWYGDTYWPYWPKIWKFEN